jgi:uncharacterized membrane protein (DUF485 family)
MDASYTGIAIMALTMVFAIILVLVDIIFDKHMMQTKVIRYALVCGVILGVALFCFGPLESKDVTLFGIAMVIDTIVLTFVAMEI